ncbi:hypothetical protein [Yoonia sp. SS1-5]|uniref:Uncharacterized protein n=1 Tax=Yoonia rhodophyticola TaxID=3137370 RepID=A0AAN0ML56_9RHOB
MTAIKNSKITITSIIFLSLNVMTESVVLAQDSNKTNSEQNDLYAYSECEVILSSPRFDELGNFVSMGHGSQIGDHAIGQELISIFCADDQIITYMEKHGFAYLGTERWDEEVGPNWAPFNVRHSFCTPPQTRLQKFLGYQCGIVAYFHLLNNQITRIPSAAVK